jgi:hypothetical protein
MLLKHLTTSASNISLNSKKIENDRPKCDEQREEKEEENLDELCKNHRRFAYGNIWDFETYSSLASTHH